MSSPSALAPTDPPVIPSPAPRGVRAVLFDADGVLQFIGTPWRQALARAGGEAFADALLREEISALEGRDSLHDVLDRLVRDLDLSTGTEELITAWWQATPDPVAWQVVRDLKAAGYLTVLTTNQQWERRAWMRRTLGYDGLCDVDAYSCTVGVAKPRPEYFRAVLDMTGLQPHEALFVDDNSENTSVAADLGIATVLHPADSGGALLRAEIVAALAGSQR